MWVEFTNNIPGTGKAIEVIDPDFDDGDLVIYWVRVQLAP